MTVLDKRLSVVERREFQKLEAIIDNAIACYVESGHALNKIKDEKLYREHAVSFDKYVEMRFGINKQAAYRLMTSSLIKKRIEAMEREIPESATISNQASLCLLGTVPEELLSDVVEKSAVIASDHSRKITQRVITQAIKEVMDKQDELKRLSEKQVFDKFVPEISNVNEYKPEAVTLEVKHERVKTSMELRKEHSRLCLENARAGEKLMYKLTVAMTALREIRSEPGMELLAGRKHAIRRMLDNAKSMIYTAMPHSICPWCDGAQCGKCGNNGWVNAILAQEYKDKRK